MHDPLFLFKLIKEYCENTNSCKTCEFKDIDQGCPFARAPKHWTNKLFDKMIEDFFKYYDKKKYIQ